MKIALFDIDGTLIRSNGAGRRAMQRALRSTAGTAGPDDHRYDGKTDRQIVREALVHASVGDEEMERQISEVLERYLDELATELAGSDHGAQQLPGAAELLDAVESRDDLVLGLLTGNLLTGAERKLRAVGIDPSRFVVGAFGSDHEHRHELPAIARDRASAHLGRAVPSEACVIIGDTPNDVACARPIGARAIAVATGGYDMESLAACRPEAVFANFLDTGAVLQAIADA